MWTMYRRAPGRHFSTLPEFCGPPCFCSTLWKMKDKNYGMHEVVNVGTVNLRRLGFTPPLSKTPIVLAFVFISF